MFVGKARSQSEVPERSFTQVGRNVYLVSWPADDGRKDGAGSVVAGESGLAHSGAVVNDKSGNFVVTHFH